MTRLKYHINFDKKNMNNGSFLEDIIEFASYKKQDNTTLNCKYLKNVFTFKKNFNITKDLKFVIRPILGNIHFFDGSGDIITKPNVLQKIYFSVGGRTTIRGFELNSIGPGKNKFNNKQKPKGKILFVMNNEIRQSLNDVIELAAFFDVGNTWGSKPGEEFSARFINELALGCGFGIRFNFKLIVLSFDLALPIHHPVKGFFKDDNFIFYFGLNYPF